MVVVTATPEWEETLIHGGHVSLETVLNMEKAAIEALLTVAD